MFWSQILLLCFFFHCTDVLCGPSSMLRIDPKLRSTADAALISPFFSIPFGSFEIPHTHTTSHHMVAKVHRVLIEIGWNVCLRIKMPSHKLLLWTAMMESYFNLLFIKYGLF